MFARRTSRGTTLLEALLAVGIAAAAIVLATTFGLNGMSITSDLHAQQDFNAASRRAEREFLRDIQQVSRFNFGFSDEDTGTLRIVIPPGNNQELTVGYLDAQGRDIWVHYIAKPSSSTGNFYLLKTTNEVDGVNYQTTILAPNVEGLTFTYYDAEGNETELVSQIRRVDMDLSLANAAVKRTLNVVGVLRAPNQGSVALPPGVQFESIEDANFLR